MDYTLFLRAVASLVFVIGLMLLLFWLIRRFDFMKLGRSSGPRRLGISESFALDSRRRLILVRRDSVEHLILLGNGSEMVVESNIPALTPKAVPTVETL